MFSQLRTSVESAMAEYGTDERAIWQFRSHVP